MKKLVIFDLDGTILDTTENLKTCMNKALKENGFKPISYNQTRAFVGNGAYLFALRACANEEKAPAVFNSFLEIYKDNLLTDVTPFNGVKELFCALKNQSVKLAVFSNKPHFATVKLCEHFFANTFDFILGKKDENPTKPNPFGLNLILQILNVNANDCILIGDGETDAQTAMHASVDFIGALWGLRSIDQLKLGGAKVFAKKPQDLINLIK